MKKEEKLTVDGIISEGLDGEVLDDAAVGVLDGELDVPVVNLDELAAGLGRDAVGDDLGRIGGQHGEGEVGVEALGGDQLGAAHGRLRGVARGGLLVLDRGEVELGILLLEREKIGQQGRRAVSLNLDEAVLVLLLAVLINKATREDIPHLIAVNGANLLEDAGLDVVAAELGEEDGNRGALEAVDQVVVAGLMESALSAPAVAVEGEEVGPAQIVLLALDGALEVVEGVEQAVTDIGGRVADRDGARSVVLDVVLDVASDGAHIRGHSADGIGLVDNLVAGEESQGVGVVLEGLDDGKSAVEIGGIVRLPRIPAAQGLADQGRVDVKDHVHAGGIEDAGARIVVRIGVEVVDTDSVDAENLEQGGITEALVGIRQGVVARRLVVGSGAARLIINADNLEAVASRGVDKVLALNLKRLDSRGDGCAKRKESRVNLESVQVSIPSIPEFPYYIGSVDGITYKHDFYRAIRNNRLGFSELGEL